MEIEVLEKPEVVNEDAANDERLTVICNDGTAETGHTSAMIFFFIGL